MWILSFQLSTDIELNCQTATVYTTSHGLIHSSLQRNLFSKHSPFGCHKQFSVNTEPQSPVENDRFILGEADSHLCLTSFTTLSRMPSLKNRQVVSLCLSIVKTEGNRVQAYCIHLIQERALGKVTNLPMLLGQDLDLTNHLPEITRRKRCS
jgi:hypothetical protein